MSEVMTLINQMRIDDKVSAERFANLAGTTVTTFSRQLNGRQRLGLNAVMAYAKYARETKNIRMLQVLAAYAVGMEPEQITINALTPDEQKRIKRIAGEVKRLGQNLFWLETGLHADNPCNEWAVIEFVMVKQ